MISSFFKKRNRRLKENRRLLTESEAWAIWEGCGKLAGVDYYEYAMKVIKAYEAKNKNNA